MGVPGMFSSEQSVESACGTGRRRWLVVAAVVFVAVAAAVFAAPEVGLAQDELQGETQLTEIMNRIRDWIQGLAGVFCVVMVCVAGARYLASSDPTGTEKAKSALRAAAIGLAIVLLASPLVDILTWFVNGSGE
jgi:hypothetical protein